MVSELPLAEAFLATDELPKELGWPGVEVALRSPVWEEFVNILMRRADERDAEGEA